MKILMVDGSDGAGKTTLIAELVKNTNVREIKFDKVDYETGGCFKIKTQRDFAFMKIVIDNLDPNKVWVMDRCYIVNLYMSHCVDKRNIEPTYIFRNWLLANHDLFELIAIADDRKDVYCDSLAEYSAEQYNEMNRFYSNVKLTGAHTAKLFGNIDEESKESLQKMRSFICP